jgi:uncharacterized glyoxalase superfamily protein PhnB
VLIRPVSDPGRYYWAEPTHRLADMPGCQLVRSVAIHSAPRVARHQHPPVAGQEMPESFRNQVVSVDSPIVLTNRSAPPVTITPVLIYPDVRAAVAWLESAFGFEERVRVGNAHRAQLRVGVDGALIVADVRGDQVAPSAGIVTHIIKVRVPDVDSAFARARNAGAHVLDEPTTHEYGERSCMFEDMSGHRWELTQTVRDVEPEEWGGVAVAPW